MSLTQSAFQLTQGAPNTLRQVHGSESLKNSVSVGSTIDALIPVVDLEPRVLQGSSSPPRKSTASDSDPQCPGEGPDLSAPGRSSLSTWREASPSECEELLALRDFPPFPQNSRRSYGGREGDGIFEPFTWLML